MVVVVVVWWVVGKCDSWYVGVDAGHHDDAGCW